MSNYAPIVILYYSKHFSINLGYKYKLRIIICLNLLIFLLLPHTNDYKKPLCIHPRIHTGEKPFTRDFGDLSFKYPSFHTKRCANTLTLPYTEYNKCRIRNTICPNLVIVLFLPTTGENPLPCEICNIHLAKHKGERPLSCLVQHINLVIFLFIPTTGENPYLCNICNIRLVEHTGEKPLSSTVCYINSYYIFLTEEKPSPCNPSVSYHILEINILIHTGKKHLCNIITHKNMLIIKPIRCRHDFR